MAIKFAKDPRFANRGRDFEELIELSNRQYAHQGLAMVHKVPTAWKPIRDSAGWEDERFYGEVTLRLKDGQIRVVEVKQTEVWDQAVGG